MKAMMMNKHTKKQSNTEKLSGALYYILIFLLAASAGAVVLKLFYPFIIAWFTAFLLRPAVKKLSALTGVCEKAVAVVILLLALLTFTGCSLLVLGRAYKELAAVCAAAAKNSGEIIRNAFSGVLSLLDRLGLGETAGEGAKELRELVVRLAEGALKTLYPGLAARAAKLPEIMLICIAFISSLFAVTVGFDKVNGFITSLLPSGYIRVLRAVKQRVIVTTLGYIRAGVLLYAVTFAELLVAFSLLGVEYPLILALAAAFLELLPVVGMGIIFVPWIIFSFLCGNSGIGVVLCVVYAAMVFTRQITESLIMGAQLGVPSFVVLLFVYAGYSAAGFTGMLLAPIAAAFAANLTAYIQSVYRKSENRQDE